MPEREDDDTPRGENEDIIGTAPDEQDDEFDDEDEDAEDLEDDDEAEA
jgi:hypothetical protein